MTNFVLSFSYLFMCILLCCWLKLQFTSLHIQEHKHNYIVPLTLVFNKFVLKYSYEILSGTFLHHELKKCQTIMQINNYVMSCVSINRLEKSELNMGSYGECHWKLIFFLIVFVNLMNCLLSRALIINHMRLSWKKLLYRNGVHFILFRFLKQTKN